jgi:hypothetical protein
VRGKDDPGSLVALTEAARSLVRKLYGAGEHLVRITIRTRSRIRIRVDVPEGRRPARIASQRPAAPRMPPTPFVPTPFQKGILQALHGQALRTDDLGRKVGSRRKLFSHPGGLRELRENNLVAHHKRLGYYRPDAPPPALGDLPPSQAR